MHDNTATATLHSERGTLSGSKHTTRPFAWASFDWASKPDAQLGLSTGRLTSTPRFHPNRHWPDGPNRQNERSPSSANSTTASDALAPESGGWTVVAEAPEGGLFFARDETGLFRFVDDVVVRVRPEGEGSKIDVRSKSRDGQGDFGANAARIRAFFDAIGA